MVCGLLSLLQFLLEAECKRWSQLLWRWHGKLGVDGDVFEHIICMGYARKTVKDGASQRDRDFAAFIVNSLLTSWLQEEALLRGI